MSSDSNIEALSNQGQFHARAPRSEPLTTKGHAPGVKVGNDALPTFSATAVPTGTAPADRLFTSNAQDDISGQGMNSEDSQETTTSAQDTLGGATSADVHTGYGHPGSGQSSKELHGDGNYPGKRERNGLAGVGGDPTNTYRERGQDIDFPKGTKGNSRPDKENIPGAEEKEPVSAEALAAEMD